MFESISHLITVACIVAGITLAVRRFRLSERPAWARWALLLPTAIAFSFGLLLLDALLTRPMLEHLQQLSHERRVDKAMAANPLWATLQDVEPATHARMRTELIRLAAGGSDPDPVALSLSWARLYPRLAATYGPHADDSSILGLVRASVALRRRLGELDPQLCAADVLRTVSKANTEALRKLFRGNKLAEESARQLDALVHVIASGAGLPERQIAGVDAIEYEVTAFLETNPQWLQGLEASVGDGPLTEERSFDDEKAAAVCAATIALHEHMLALEPAVGAMILRAWMKSARNGEASSAPQ